MSSFVCRVQFLDDTDPFNSTNFPEPTRPPQYTFREDIPLINQIAGVHRLLKAPHKLDDCALQLSHNGVYLDLELSLDEQRDELEGFQQDDCGGRGKKHSVILRTQLSVRVHACIEKLYNSNGRDLRRALFSLKQIFQDDKDLVHEFVMAEGLTCLIKVGSEADQNYQNYILRALGQIMLYVDGMNGVIGHPETLEWLYVLIGSKFRLVVKTALKLLLVFVEYSESNAVLLIQAINSVDTKRGCKLWSNAIEILAEKDGVDTELLVYVMTLINKTLAALPDQDSFYDMVDVLEEQEMESVSRRYLGRKGTDLDLLEQLNIYEATLRHEDGDEDSLPPSSGRQERRGSSVGGGERRGLERRRSRRHSLARSDHASPLSPASPHRTNFQQFNGQELNEREEDEDDSPLTESNDDDDDDEGEMNPSSGVISAPDDKSDNFDKHTESFTKTARTKEDEREEEEKRRNSSNSAPLTPDSTQPSLLATLLAQRKSSISVPPTNEVSPPLRGSAQPCDCLPYLPHSPFFLFSYDVEEEEKPVEKSSRSFSAISAPSTPTKQQSDRPALGGLLSSSYRQHQESLAAERERRRVEREERLQRIEREERNRQSRDYVANMEEARHAREERFKTVERLAAEEFERDRVRSAPRGLSLTLSSSDTCQSSRSATPSSQDDQDTPVTSYPSSEPDTNDLELDMGATLEPEEKVPEPREELEEEQEEEQEEEVEGISAEQEVGGAEEQVAEDEEEPEREVPDGEAEDSGILSDKERQNEEVNEKDNCSASSISSASSTLEREDRLGSSETGQWSQSINANEQRSKILHSKLFMLDMLYSQSKKPSEEDEDEEEHAEVKDQDVKEREQGDDSAMLTQDASSQEENSRKSDGDKKVENQGNVRAFAERFGDLVKGLSSPPIEMQEGPEKQLAPPPPPPQPPKKESDYIWDQLMESPRELRIGDINFTDLGDEDDQDILDSASLLSSGDLAPAPPPPPPCPFNLPPPPPMFGCPPPPPLFNIRMPPPPPCFSTPAVPPPGSPQLGGGEQPLFQKRKKTIRLFWSEVRPADWIFRNHKRSQESLWSRLEPVKLDTAKFEHLFESKSKEMPVTKTAADGKRQEIIVLDSKRSNSINIGLTVLPPPRTIKTAILNFDEYALNKEGIEKILTMIPTEEETQKIQEAQLANPDLPLGSAEQFLLTLSSISELSARLQLWAFKLDYETTEQEVAEPLQDLKEGMDQLEKNKTLRYILSTLLAIGNFLNGSNAKGFDLNYLEKVPEVKDTVHKQSLLHHVCSIVVENFPESTDLYSEIGALTRSAKVDFDQLQENLTQMEWRCKASWDHLKVIAKHEMKPALKQKMSDFLKDCAERIIILKIVHRRIMNRFHAFLLFLGHPVYSVREISVNRFSKIISEFALEYRTTRDRVLQQKQKRANHRERNKTRGKMITDINQQTDDEEDSEAGRLGGKSSSVTPAVAQESEPQGLGHAEDAAEHEQMKAVLKTSLQGGDSDTTVVPGLRTRTRTRASRGRNTWAAVNDDPQCVTDDAADEIMERIVRSATQGPRERAQPCERRRSRANRKSLRRTLKGGLTPEEAKALGFDSSEMPV
ncbi:FH1/FH2 domain-containing protein 3-like isoform X2 [Myxocyprinus asiaticus]|uniref:FH1/FH2 domain-containing protein 3-like isoform X2 n=1 Tax=Myxocyprinus asiaticus TaxID=70543 RepID=UPI0022217CC8|nr:FH1/FH2 domain-containing protein 3-like isoform X2 [Myxocyprinus asiaticus]